ncbi:MAG: hypothetical protein R2695_21920 [Acidimicrobiales bacterium]
MQRIAVVPIEVDDPATWTTVDWMVLPDGAHGDEIDADLVRQPLDVELALVSRLADEDQRIGLMEALDPLAVADAVQGVSGRSVGQRPEGGAAPAGVLVDVPVGALEPLGDEIVAELTAAGVDAAIVPTEPAAFAGRVASGEATVFPILIAGGAGRTAALLDMATPGGPDDVFGEADEARVELAAALRAAPGRSERTALATALRQRLIDQGWLLPSPVRGRGRSPDGLIGSASDPTARSISAVPRPSIRSRSFRCGPQAHPLRLRFASGPPGGHVGVAELADAPA